MDIHDPAFRDREAERLAEVLHRIGVGCHMGNFVRGGDHGHGCIVDHHAQASLFVDEAIALYDRMHAAQAEELLDAKYEIRDLEDRLDP